MKLSALLLLSLCLTSPLSAQQPRAEAEVRAVVTHEIEGWAKFDAKQVASCYSEDAAWQNPFGVRLHGRAQLERFLTSLFNRPGYRAATDTAPAKILEIRMESPTVATAWTDESSKGQIDDRTRRPMAPRHSWYMEVLVKKDGVWKITESLISDEKTP